MDSNEALATGITRYQLVPSAPDADGDRRPGRRYKLARLQLNQPPPPGDGRFEYLKRSHD